MLTKDFIKKVEELGLYVDKSEKFGLILVTDSNHGLVAYVKNNERSQFSTAFASFDNLLEPMQRKLIELIGMYARTLPDKREQEQKFYLQLTTLIATGTENYLNYNTTNGSFVLSGRCQTPKWQTQFTQAEIDEMKEKFGAALSGFEKIPVKDEEIEEC